MEFGRKVKRVVILCLLAAVAVFLVLRCMSRPLQKMEIPITETEHLYMEAVDGASSTGAEVRVVNSTGQTFVYGSYYELHRLVDGAWYTMSYVTDRCDFTAEERFLEPGEHSWSYSWRTLYGRILPGTYRVAVSFYSPEEKRSYQLAAEFTV